MHILTIIIVKELSEDGYVSFSIKMHSWNTRIVLDIIRNFYCNTRISSHYWYWWNDISKIGVKRLSLSPFQSNCDTINFKYFLTCLSDTTFQNLLYSSNYSITLVERLHYMIHVLIQACYIYRDKFNCAACMYVPTFQHQGQHNYKIWLCVYDMDMYEHAGWPVYGAYMTCWLQNHHVFFLWEKHVS